MIIIDFLIWCMVLSLTPVVTVLVVSLLCESFIKRPTLKADEIYYCGVCGYIEEDGGKFCRYCGAMLALNVPAKGVVT